MSNGKSCRQAGIISTKPHNIESWVNKGLIEGLLYYGNGRKTDKPYIKYPLLYTGGKLINKGKVKLLVYGRVNKGDFLSTYFVYGVAFSSGNVMETSFAISLEDKFYEGIDFLNAEFL